MKSDTRGGRHVAKGRMSDLNPGWLLSTCNTFIVMEYFYSEVLLLQIRLCMADYQHKHTIVPQLGDEL